MIQMIDRARHLRSARRGFTLLELVLVMVIAATALAVAAPSLRNWRKGNALRTSMEEMLQVLRYARTQSISQARVYRIEFGDDLTYVLKMRGPQGSEYVEVPGEFGKLHHLPVNSKLEVEKAPINNEVQEASARVIDFYPTGRTQPAVIKVTDEQNFVVMLECKSPAGKFNFVSEGVAQ